MIQYDGEDNKHQANHIQDMIIGKPQSEEEANGYPHFP